MRSEVCLGGRHLRRRIFYVFRALAGLLPKLPTDSPNAPILAALLAKNPEDIIWDEIHAGELVLLAVMPLEMLQAKFGNLVDQYRTVTGGEPFARGTLLNPPKTREEWLAGVVTLMEELAKYRRSKLMFERCRSTLGFVFGLLLLLVFFAGFFWVQTGYNKIVLWQPLLFTGLIGAGFSVLTRLYSLKWTPRVTAEIEDVQALKKGLVINCTLSLAEGVIAACVVYLLFTSGLLKGQLFPEFNDLKIEGTNIFARFIDYEPKDSTDVAKLLVWAFIAGFAERLVPDKLNRLAGSASNAKNEQLSRY
jgi:hypothetical protein